MADDILNEMIKKVNSAQNAQKAQEHNKAPKPTPVEKKQLPLWPETVRAIPNGFLRSALFGIISKTKGSRRYINGENIAAIEGVTIRYKGERLDQEDLEVWENILHVMRLQNLNNQCRITSYALLKMIDKTDSGKNRATLQERIERLVANAITITQGQYSYIGSLISFAAKDDESRIWVIEMNPHLCSLFASDQFTQVDWAVRNELKGKPLAQWLHGFYASHAQPYPIKVETLLRLCGSESELRRYRQTLHDAMKALSNASTAHGENFNYEIRNDLVYVEKQTTKSTNQKYRN